MGKQSRLKKGRRAERNKGAGAPLNLGAGGRQAARKGGDQSKVFIAVPSVDGDIHYELAATLMQWLQDQTLPVTIRFYGYMAPLDSARNAAIKDFLEGHWEYFCMVDDDIVPPAGGLKRLVNREVDCVAPLCFTMKPDNTNRLVPIPVAFKENSEGKFNPVAGTGLVETDNLTGGMFLVHRRAIEALELPIFRFSYDEWGITYYSEDLIFGRALKNKGFNLYTDFEVVCKHFREVDIKTINDLAVRVQQESEEYGRKCGLAQSRTIESQHRPHAPPRRPERRLEPAAHGG